VSVSTLMRRFARWHIWLGWAAGVPLVLWTLSGLVMAWKPIEDVRGTALRAQPHLVGVGPFTTPPLEYPSQEIRLVKQPLGHVWIVTEADGRKQRYYAPDGSLIPPVIESEARDIAAANWAGTDAPVSVTYFPADANPMDLRAGINAWQARYADGTNLYIDAATGEVVAVRTGWWRVFDFMWGLHIMDLQEREDTSHPVLIVFAVLALVTCLFGTTLMFRRRKAKVTP
jgi:hypothetical protein